MELKQTNPFTGVNYIHINAAGKAEIALEKSQDSTPRKISKFLKGYRFTQDVQILKEITAQEKAWKVLDTEERNKLPHSLNPFLLSLEKIKATFKFVFQFIANGLKTNESLINDNIVRSQLLQLETLLKADKPESLLSEMEGLIDELNKTKANITDQHYKDLKIQFASFQLNHLEAEFKKNLPDVDACIALIQKLYRLQEKTIAGSFASKDTKDVDLRFRALKAEVEEALFGSASSVLTQIGTGTKAILKSEKEGIALSPEEISLLMSDVEKLKKWVRQKIFNEIMALRSGGIEPYQKLIHELDIPKLEEALLRLSQVYT